MKMTTSVRIALLSLVGFASPLTGHCQTYTYNTLTVPGASDTYIMSISGSTVLGYFEDSNGLHGFTESGGAYTTFDDPAATVNGQNYGTLLLGMSGSTVIGCYFDSNGGYGQGFIETGGTYNNNVVPGVNNVNITGISGSTEVGYFNGNGFIGLPQWKYIGTPPVNTLVWTPVAVPSAVYTYPAGIDGSTVVGSCQIQTGSVYPFYGFSYTDGAYTILHVPGAFNTYCSGVSGGTIVGSFSDSDGGISQGFSYTDGAYTILDVPGAVQSYATGVSGNTIVGYSEDNSFITSGFIATPIAIPEPTSLSLLAFGVLGLIYLRRRSS